jgi:glycosyltransferase involved in cell wall biosynthesis
MHVLIVYEGVIPAFKYGGIERVIWYLGKELVKLGHRVTFLVGTGSSCNFAKVRVLNPGLPVSDQIPDEIDVVHICHLGGGIEQGKIDIPYINMVQINFYDDRKMNVNSVFVSKNHAERFGSNVFVHNGMDWADYSPVKLNNNRKYFHFLGIAAWSVKNIRGAIQIIKKTPHETLHVLGGHRLNFNMGFRFTISPRIKFHGMVGGSEKSMRIQGSKGLLLPVIWHEPFGIAITESLYFGCPVFGTPYGSQSELISEDVGFLSNDSSKLANALMHVEDYSRKRCHEYARDQFNSAIMTQKYVKLYEKVLNGQQLNANQPTLIDTKEGRKLPWN